MSTLLGIIGRKRKNVKQLCIILYMWIVAAQCKSNYFHSLLPKLLFLRNILPNNFDTTFFISDCKSLQNYRLLQREFNSELSLFSLSFISMQIYKNLPKKNFS